MCEVFFVVGELFLSGKWDFAVSLECGTCFTPIGRRHCLRLPLKRGSLRIVAHHSGATMQVSLSSDIDKSKFKELPPDHNLSSPKDKWAHKRNAHSRRSLPSANTGRAPSEMGVLCSHSPHWPSKNLFPKRFLRSFFLKKATLRAAAPPARRRLADKSKFLPHG